MNNAQHLTIRLAAARDADVVRRLAALDSVAPLAGRVLLAESDGTAVAALSLETGGVAADPFQPTEGAVRMLSLRRYQLMRQGADVAPTRSILRRLAHGTA
jgi:hypothetical protein